jgi:hypothetical protein
MELGSYFLFVQEQIKDIIIITHRETEAHFTASGMPSQRNQSE